MRFLAQYGRRLLDAGYEIVPLRPGLKHPGMTDWQRVPSNAESLGKWLANGRANDGVGIRTARTPAVDIDVLDLDAAEHMEAWCQEQIGFAPVRVGKAPKRLLVYRAEQPFPKMSSTWVSPDGVDQKVEILGDGQQFCSYHVHPETGQPYTWIGRDSLLTVDRQQLEVLTVDGAKAILAEFDRLAEAKGWRRKTLTYPLERVNQTGKSLTGPVTDDDWLAGEQGDVEIDDAALRSYLMAIEDADDYDVWLHVGMALHHHYKGTDDGLELWREWSERSSKYDAEALTAKWSTLQKRGDRPVKTVRYIIMLGRRASQQQVAQRVVSVKERFAAAQSIEAISAIAAEVARAGDVSTLGRETLVGALKAAFKRVEGAALADKTARGMLKASRSDAERPNWLSGWCFLAGEDEFYNHKTGERVTKIGFNARYDRYMLSTADKADGRMTPSVSASDFALSQVSVPYTTAYMPTEGQEFSLSGRLMANTYRDTLVPAVPEKLTARERAAVERVKAHFELLFPDARERGIILSFLSYVVRTLGRVNYALVIQSAQGDGKSFLMPLMGAVLGDGNAKVIAPSTMSHGGFTAFASSALLGIVEEVKLHGHNRYDVLNAVKPLITNPVIEVHSKGKDPINVPNTMSYILLTNFADALPVTDEDNRYFVVNGRFQTQEALRAFLAQNPGYHDKLFDAINEAPGALRGWLMDYPPHPEFKPKGRAPWSRGQKYMARMSASTETTAVKTALEETKRRDVTELLLDQQSLKDEIERIAEQYVETRQVRRVLSDMGYKEIGRLSVNGSVRVLWSMTPQEWEVEPGLYDKVRLYDYLTG